MSTVPRAEVAPEQRAIFELREDGLPLGRVGRVDARDVVRRGGDLEPFEVDDAVVRDGGFRVILGLGSLRTTPEKSVAMVVEGSSVARWILA